MATTRDPTDLRGQEVDTEAQQQRHYLKQRQETEDLKWLLAHRQGRRIECKLMGDAGIFRSMYNHSRGDMAFNDAQRSQGLKLLTMVMEHAPEAFTLMQKEAKAHDD